MIQLEASRHLVEKALDLSGGTHTFEDVCQMVSEGRLQYWPGPNSVVITEIIEYPRKRTLHFFIAAGNIAELEVMYPPIEQWGKQQGCDSASLTGRKGWERSFLTRREGWNDPKLVVMTKEL